MTNFDRYFTNASILKKQTDKKQPSIKYYLKCIKREINKAAREGYYDITVEDSQFGNYKKEITTILSKNGYTILAIPNLFCTYTIIRWKD